MNKLTSASHSRCVNWRRHNALGQIDPPLVPKTRIFLKGSLSESHKDNQNNIMKILVGGGKETTVG